MEAIKNKIKKEITLFIVCLCLSGITAFPLLAELKVMHNFFSNYEHGLLLDWVDNVYYALQKVNDEYPFMAYGTDWLAFSHLVIAVAFIGPLEDPVKNIWVIQFGRIASIMVFPLAFICGNIRGIPFWWQLIDCSFGLGGFLLLSLIHKHVLILENKQTQNQ